MTEKQIEKIKKKIRSLRAQLAAEKRKHGWYDDSWGSRYAIAELYIKIKDYKGALRYYNWFRKEFSDDVGFPDFHLFGAMTYYENHKIPEAVRMVYKTSFSNTYLIDFLCGKNPASISKSELSGAEFHGYGQQVSQEIKDLLTPGFLDWLVKLNESEEYRKNLNTFISLQKLIKDEPVGKERSTLIEKSWDLEERLTAFNI